MQDQRAPGERTPPSRRRHPRGGGERLLAIAALLAAVAVVAVVGGLARSSASPRESAWTFVSGLETSRVSALDTSRASAPDPSHVPGFETSQSSQLPQSEERETSVPETTQSTSTSLPGSFLPQELVVLTAPLPADAVAVKVPVLMYHYVDETPPPAGPYADSLTVRTPEFVKQLEYLRSGGFSTVSLAQVYLAMAGALALPSKPVVLTFDDGGLDNYEVAFPLLKSYGFIATFFVITSRVGKEGQMTWDQLREMNQAGMAVQSHTVSHPDLTQISGNKLAQELVDSRAKIEEEIKAPVYALAYPAGAYNSRVIEATKAAGYSLAVSTDEGGGTAPETVFEIKRARIQPGLSLTTFARLVGGH